MNAAVLHATGRPPRCEEFPEPVANGNEVLVHVRAAALKPLDKQMASGSHYAAYREFPSICGTDGVGQLHDGTRVFFAGPQPPYGSMAERTVVHRARYFPLPPTISDETAAAVVNPGLSAWAHSSGARSLCRVRPCSSSAPPASLVNSRYKRPSCLGRDAWSPPDETTCTREPS